MKLIKTILGCLILFGLSNEYFDASISHGRFFSPFLTLGTLLLLIIPTWLIGSGMS